MRKILMVALLLVMSLTSMCSAEFKNPNLDRWITLVDNKEYGYWYDKETVKYTMNMKSYDSCYKHKIVQCWILMYEPEQVENPSAKIFTELDLTCNTIKNNYIILYDKNNKQVSSEDVSFLPPKPVAPETVGEYMVLFFKEEWDKNVKTK